MIHVPRTSTYLNETTDVSKIKATTRGNVLEKEPTHCSIPQLAIFEIEPRDRTTVGVFRMVRRQAKR